MKRNKINFQLSDMKLDELWLKTRRGVLYALYLIGALLVQNVILSHVALFGVRAMFLPALVVAAALFEGGWGGGLFGLAAGILSDLFFGSQSVLFTVLFPVMGFIAGFLGDFYLNKRLFTYCILGAAALFLAAFAQMFDMGPLHGIEHGLCSGAEGGNACGYEHGDDKCEHGCGDASPRFEVACA